MPKIQINNKDVNFLELNKGAPETVVMVHGMFTNMSVFYFKIAPELAKHFHVVLYDLKSHGMSERSESGYDLVSLSKDLISLLDVLELSKVHLVGYSYGGLIALNTALTIPERIGKLAIIDTPRPDNEVDRPTLLREYSDDFIDQYLEKYMEVTKLQPGNRQLKKAQNLSSYLLNETSIQKDFLEDRLFLRTAEIESINSQTILLYGTESDCNDTGLELERRIPNAEYHVGKGDHNIPVQNPEWISEKLNNFFIQ